MNNWSIRDEATGEWWNGITWTSDNRVARYDSYRGAACSVVFTEGAGYREDARIVPAPPAQMTDEECWEWLNKHPNLAITARNSDPKGWAIWGGFVIPYCEGDTPCDAIRAAAKAIAK